MSKVDIRKVVVIAHPLAIYAADRDARKSRIRVFWHHREAPIECCGLVTEHP